MFTSSYALTVADMRVVTLASMIGVTETSMRREYTGHGPQIRNHSTEHKPQTTKHRAECRER